MRKAVGRVSAVFLDPRGDLQGCVRSLVEAGVNAEVLTRVEDLLAGGTEGPVLAYLTVVDGEGPSGLEPASLLRSLSAGGDWTPLVLAVVSDDERGRAWVGAGACAYLLRPLDTRVLRAEVERWLVVARRLDTSQAQLLDLRRFFAMFAHDIKNPLNAVSAYCELVSAHPQLPEDAREDLGRVRRNVDLLCRMAQGLLELARGSARLSLAPREADLAPVVREAVEMMQVRAQARGTTLLLRGDDLGTAVNIDAARVIEALANVLDNAIKFSPERSTVEVLLSAAGEEAVITVDDQGPGIDPAVMEGAFGGPSPAAIGGPHNGLGLGLSIARDIVELHRGVIRAERRSPGGTRVSIRLPRVTAVEPAAAGSGPSTTGRREAQP